MFRSRDRFEKKVREYLEACYRAESPPRVTELAERLGITVAQLGRLFRKLFGGNVSDYLKGHQVEHAEVLLRDTRLTVTQIAYKAAFGTRRTFFRVYRRVKGETPDQFRARTREE